jgi:hypothetical protein
MELIYLLITHFVADFILQNRWIAENKSSKVTALFTHTFIIFICFIHAGLEFAFYNAVAHMFIDGTLWNIYKAFWGLVFKRRKLKDHFLTIESQF